VLCNMLLNTKVHQASRIRTTFGCQPNFGVEHPSVLCSIFLGTICIKYHAYGPHSSVNLTLVWNIQVCYALCCWAPYASSITHTNHIPVSTSLWCGTHKCAMHYVVGHHMHQASRLRTILRCQTYFGVEHPSVLCTMLLNTICNKHHAYGPHSSVNLTLVWNIQVCYALCCSAPYASSIRHTPMLTLLWCGTPK
jgi:hypothetical protein